MIGRKIKVFNSLDTFAILDKIIINGSTGYMLQNDNNKEIWQCRYSDIERIVPLEDITKEQWKEGVKALEEQRTKAAEGYIPPCDTGLSDALHPTIENFKRGL